MQTAVETLEDDKVRIRVEIDAHDVDHAFEHALSDLARDVRIPGFRKGKVPPAVLRQRLGDEAVRDEALRTHLDGWWRRACSAAGVEAIGRPEIDWDAPPVEGAPFAFTGVVAVPPAAVLPDDLELAAARPATEIPDDEVDAEIERMRLAAAAYEAIDAAVEAGHQVLVDMRGSVDGKPIKDAQATDLLVEAGSGRLLDELDAALIGLRAGETREVPVVLPEGQRPKRLAGREAVFAVAVKEVRARVLPEADDAFARDMAGFDSLDELRADIRATREAAQAEEADGRFRRNVLQDLGAQAEVEVPFEMVQVRVDDRLQSMARSLGQQGISLEQYLAMMGRDARSLAMEMLPEAEREVREELALAAYADRLGVEVDDAAVRAFLAEQAAAEGAEDDAVERIMGDASMREDVRRDLRLRDALDRAVAQSRTLTAEEAEARWNARRPEGGAEAKSQQATDGDDADGAEQEN
jgi:trigger factor